jgi:hypothetical protein
MNSVKKLSTAKCTMWEKYRYAVDTVKQYQAR